jgi:uncharacterized protein (TIRG00374 family)
MTELSEDKKTLQSVSPRKAILPILIGVAVAVFLFYRNYQAEYLDFFIHANLAAIGAAFFVLLARDIGYIYRIYYLTGKSLSRRASVFVVLLWEFASAVTPSAVGGTAVAIFILNREGIPMGKSLAYVMLTAILDNGFFIVAAPLVLLFTKGSVFNIEFSQGFLIGFSISYTLIALYTFLMAYGLLVKPRAFKWILLKITAFRFFKRWRLAAYNTGNDMIRASAEMRGKDGGYWLKAIGYTLFAWVARYAMLNFLIWAFTDLTLQNHLMIFSRQVILWIVMLISITPGSTGTAEYFFTEFYREFLGDFSSIVGIIWRIFTYYPYLFIGVLLLPYWLRKTGAQTSNKPLSQ